MTTSSSHGAKLDNMGLNDAIVEGLVGDLLPAVWDVGERLRAKAAAGRSSFSLKSSVGDLVTDLDHFVEGALIRKLSPLLPEASIVSEEAGITRERLSEPTWVIDPIDGTTNLVHGLPYLAISVALVSQGATEIGIVHNPFTRETYFAISGRGAFEMESPESQPDAIRVSGVAELSSALMGFGLPYDRSNADNILEAVRRIFPLCQDLRRQGSSALDMVGVARGQLDGYFELDLHTWDIAASSLILQEAGGQLTTWEGKHVFIDPRGPQVAVVASNGLIHDAILSATHEL